MFRTPMVLVALIAASSISNAAGNRPPSEHRSRIRWSGVPSGHYSGWLKAEGTPVTDVSERFKPLYEAAKNGRLTLFRPAKDYVYLLIGGLFTNQYPGYMVENLRALQRAGLDAPRVSVDTGASVRKNAKAIRDAVIAANAGGKRVVLIGQSKGAVDATAALALYPEIRAKVRAMIAIQAPYGGTPIASDIRNCPELEPLVKRAVGWLFQGDMKSLSDLSYETRRIFVRLYPYPTTVPTLALASARKSLRSILDATAGYLRDRYGLLSDGLVPQVDAEIPGSRVVRLTDMDHAESVMKGLLGFPNYQPGPLTLALVSLALAK